MKVHHCKIKLDVDDLAGKKLGSEHFDHVLGGDEACDVYKPDGSPLLKYRPNWFDANLCKSVLPACRKAARKTFNRGMAAGVLSDNHEQDGKRIAEASKVSYRHLKRDGTISNTNTAVGVASGVVGYFDRSVRLPFCRQTSFVIQEAAAWRKFLPYIVRADAGFKEFMPDRWKAQKEYASKTARDWIIPESTFTTVTVNRNFQTATHKDAGDLSSGFGVMSCLRNDKYSGAYLVFPAYRVAVDYSHGSLCLADVHEWHSNTAFEKMKIGYERITLVFYYRENMIHCKSAKEEVELAKNRKPGQKMK